MSYIVGGVEPAHNSRFQIENANIEALLLYSGMGSCVICAYHHYMKEDSRPKYDFDFSPLEMKEDAYERMHQNLLPSGTRTIQNECEKLHFLPSL